MRINKLVSVAVASSLFATPVMANTASSLSVAKAMGAKASTSGKKLSKLSGEEILILFVATAGVTGGIVAATSGKKKPDSN